MEKLNRAQQCSILGPQNLGSRGAPPGSAPVNRLHYLSSLRGETGFHWYNLPGECRCWIWLLTVSAFLSGESDFSHQMQYISKWSQSQVDLFTYRVLCSLSLCYGNFVKKINTWRSVHSSKFEGICINLMYKWIENFFLYLVLYHVSD